MQEFLNFDGSRENSALDLDDEEDPIECIKEMLFEADQMPVVMDEVPLLRCHVQALEWAVKARQVLPSADAISKISMKDVDANGEDNIHEVIHGEQTTKSLKFAELQKLDKDIIK